MRKQSFMWAFLVLSIVLTAYGGYSIIYSLNRSKDAPILGVVFFIIGVVLLVIFLILLFISLIQRKMNRAQKEVVETKEEIIVDDEEDEVTPKSEPVIEEEPASIEESAPRYRDVTYESTRTVREFDGGSAYIKRVGYGPVLRVEEEEILDMRTNTYYRIEGNVVYRSGSGIAFEISGNRIKEAFGAYLYEISGNNINKVFGGYYASISGGYIQTYDLKEKYEVTGRLNLKQQLTVVILLFGTY